jgi:hypothetical protein
MVFVGDLLTYGHDVDEVLDLVGEAQASDHAHLVIGNHDQMYFDGTLPETLPTWIADSVRLTRTQLRGPLRDRFTWTDEYLVDGVLVSHANPFGFGSVRYLVADTDDAPACAALAARGARVGIFGHTHRPRWRGCGPGAEPPLDEPLACSLDTPLLVNAGTVGQPRDLRRRSVILRIAIEADRAGATFEPVDYDVAAHVEALRRLPLPQPTIDHLCSFFRHDP